MMWQASTRHGYLSNMPVDPQLPLVFVSLTRRLTRDSPLRCAQPTKRTALFVLVCQSVDLQRSAMI